MAYSVKYLFKFESSNGTTREIRVLQDGYTGEVIQRPLGRAPVLKKQQNGPVHGTSLEFYAECNVDREFIEFYTSDPKAYRVDLYAGATLLWRGYITPELYSEPDIAPPYDVQVVATDGVGELKLYDYAAQGAVTLRTLLSGLLSRTGLGTDIYLISSLKPGSAGAGSLLEKTINLDYMAGESCYDVLTYLLDTLHATITWWKGAWILARETNVTFTNGKVRYFNTAGNSALLNDSVQVLGKMYVNPAWPVGQLSTVIDPAKNRVTVQAPWHVVTCLRNSDMTSDASWAKSNDASYGPDGYLFPNNDEGASTYATAYISQALAMEGLRVPMSFELRATGVSAQVGVRVGAAIGVLLTYTVENVVYHLRKGSEGTPEWTPGPAIGTSIDGSLVDYQRPLASFDMDRIQAETLQITEIPAFVQGTSYPSGMLTVYILGTCARVYAATLDVVLPKGYQDILRIDNGARGEGGEVEIAIGRVTADNAYYAAFLQGLLLDSGNLITSFSDANFPGGMDYLAFIARDYALSVALPRAKVTGTVYLESGIAAPPLVFTKGALNYWLQTWSWNLYEDELEIEGLTLPSASLTVESETILESTAGASSSSGRTSGGGGAPISPGTSMAAVQEWVNSQGYLASVEAASTYATITALNGVSSRVTTLEGRTNWDTYFGVDENGDIYVKKNGNTARNFYSWGAVSAGGVSSGGGASGVDLAAVWANLTANTGEGLNKVINVAHIPALASISGNLTVSRISDIETWISGKGYLTAHQSLDGYVNDLTRTPASGGNYVSAVTKSGKTITVTYATLPTSLPASDVYSWAKAETKPSYTFSEITGTASTSQIPTLAISKISGLQDALNGKQASDADLTAIAGLTGTSGFLKKTATNTWVLDTLVYERTYTYQIPASAGVRISFEPNASCYITASRTNNGGQLVLIGTGYGAEGTVRNAFTEVVSSSWFDWSLPASSGISTSVEILLKSDSGVAYITVHSSGSITFTAIDALTTPAQNAHLWSRNNSGSTDYPWSASWLALNGALFGATTISASGQAEVGSLKLASGTPTLTWDANANAWHLSGNFYADGFISAGGVSSGGGSEGVNLTAVWDNLVANTGEGLNKVINVAHIPSLASISGNLTVSRISDIETWISGKGYLTSLSFAGLTSHPTTLSGYGITDWVVKVDSFNSPDTFTTAGVYRVSSQSGATNFQYGQVLVLRGTSSSDTITQVAFPYSSNNIYFRRGTTSNFTSDTWKTILNSANYTSYVNTTNFPGLNKTGTVTSVAMTVPTGLSVSGSPITTSGTLAISLASGYSIPTTAKQSNWDTAYGWGNHADAGYLTGNQTITLSGDVSGSGATTIAVAIGTGKVTNAMLAGSIANGKLANSAITINGLSTSLGGSFSTASITAGTAGQSTASSGMSFSVPYITMNAYGIVTGYGTHTHTISAQNLYDTIGTTTYAPYNSAGYLPLSGGKMTGPLTWKDLNALPEATSAPYFLTIDSFANGGTTKWVSLANAKISLGLSNYLPLAGGTMTGAITPASGQSSVLWACSSLKLGWYASRITAAGWYRFYTASNADNLGNSVILHIDRSYGNNNNESYTIAVNIAYNGGISVTQLNGYANQQLITKVRVDYTPSGALYVDFYSVAPAGSGNTVYVTCEGKGSIQGPTTVSSPTGTTKEYALIPNGLATSGNILATGAITAGSASDARLKTNIQTLSAESAKHIVMALNPVTFTWNEKATELYDQYKGDDLGFVAQEVENVLPVAIGTIFEKYKRLDQTKFIAPLVVVAKDHETRIEKLEKEVKARDAKIMELENEVKRLRN